MGIHEESLSDEPLLCCRFYCSEHHCVFVIIFIFYHLRMLGKVCDIVSFVAMKTFSAKAEQIKGKAPGRNVFTPQVLAEADY